MSDTPFGPLESLVGRAFERDGEQRKVDGVSDQLALVTLGGALLGTTSAPIRAYIRHDPLIVWLSGAEEVKGGQG